MATKTATTAHDKQSDSAIFAEMDDCLSEIARIRREMKKTDQEIQRLELSTGRKIAELKASLHAKKAA